jgi:CBS domain containing-hemolysin-like protein
VGVFAAIFTVLVLALTEIVPKSLGVRYASSLGTLIVWPVQLMIWSVWPVVWVAKRAMRLLGAGAVEGPSEEEVVLLAGLAAESGGVRSEERRWVANALRLDRVSAGDLRTPRTVVESFPTDTRLAELVAKPSRWVHSRVPLTEGNNLDRIVGMVHRRDAFEAALSNPEAELILGDLVQPIEFVPEAMAAHELLDLFLEKRTHMAAVMDEYGGFEGVVTLEDVLECLLGREIVDEYDRVEDMKALALERSRARREGGS